MTYGMVLAALLAIYTAFGLPVGAAIVLFMGAAVEGYSPEAVQFVAALGLVAILLRHFAR